MLTQKPIAAVTGASAGIGAEFARQLAARGYDLLLIARREDRLRQVAGEIEKSHGNQAEILAADLASDADLARVEVRLRETDRLELLVNNAGFGTRGFFTEIDVEGQDRMHRVHVLAIVRLTHAALAGMVRRNRGAIVNVASVAGFAQSPGNTSYCATKTWINSFTEGLYLELQSRGSAVRIQSLCPGYTYSEFHDVMGMDRNTIPKGWWMPAEVVVGASLAGLDAGKLFVIPGLRYRLLVRMLKLLPGALRRPGPSFTLEKFAGKTQVTGPKWDNCFYGLWSNRPDHLYTEIQSLQQPLAFAGGPAG